MVNEQRPPPHRGAGMRRQMRAPTFPKARRRALAQRLAGIALNGLFWFAVGTRAIPGDLASMFAMAPFLASLWAVWARIRRPAVP